MHYPSLSSSKGTMKKPSPPLHALRIRKAALPDAGRLAALATELRYPSTVAEVRRRLRRVLKSPGHAVFVAETFGDGVVGWAHAFVHALVETDTFAEVGGLVVDTRHRGRGIGERLMSRVERWAGARGLKSVYLRSNVIRKDAHTFYKKLGYRIIKTQFAFRKSA